MESVSLTSSFHHAITRRPIDHRTFVSSRPRPYGSNPTGFSMNCKPHLAGTKIRSSPVDDIPAITSTPAEITWQIVVGALAGVAPFVVAGIEFSKRIMEQKNCKVCRGSGLVLRDNKYYFRCPACGGFLPWQSWRRFFTG